jgi:glycogen operon protein
MTIRDWENPGSRSLGVFLNGEGLTDLTPWGERERDDSFLLMFNAHFEPVSFRVPARRFGARWELELSTAEPELERGSRTYAARADVPLVDRSVAVLRRV